MTDCKNISIFKWSWVILPFIILLVFLMRFNLLALPLERDEGEYAYIAQLMLHGIPPYAQVYTMKMPGVHVIYAIIIAAFGHTPMAIHTGLMLLNMVTALFIFLLARRLMSVYAAAAACACFIVLSSSPNLLGMTANAEHFVILPAIIGLYLLLVGMDTDRKYYTFAAGFCLGIAFLMKQQGAFFIAIAGLYLIYDEICKRPFRSKSCLYKIVIFSAGVFIPFGAACLILKKAGVFETFWFWTFIYPNEYITSYPLSEGLKILKSELPGFILPSFFLWLLSILATIAVFFDKKIRAHSVFICLFAFFSILSIIPGFHFRLHYFLLVVPIASILYGIAIQTLLDYSPGKPTRIFIPFLVIVLGLFHSVNFQSNLLFPKDINMVSRTIYGTNPFPEALEIAKYIKEHSSSNDRIAILGSEPEILFYADRKSASSYIYMYYFINFIPCSQKRQAAAEPSVEAMRNEFIQQIQLSKPKFFVFVNVFASWGDIFAAGEKKCFDYDKSIPRWAAEYTKQFKRVGTIIIRSKLLTEYYWDQEASQAIQSTAPRIFIYKRI